MLNATFSEIFKHCAKDPHPKTTIIYAFLRPLDKDAYPTMFWLHRVIAGYPVLSVQRLQVREVPRGHQWPSGSLFDDIRALLRPIGVIHPILCCHLLPMHRYVFGPFWDFDPFLEFLSIYGFWILIVSASLEKAKCSVFKRDQLRCRASTSLS